MPASSRACDWRSGRWIPFCGRPTGPLTCRCRRLTRCTRSTKSDECSLGRGVPAGSSVSRADRPRIEAPASGPAHPSFCGKGKVDRHCLGSLPPSIGCIVLTGEIKHLTAHCQWSTSNHIHKCHDDSGRVDLIECGPTLATGRQAQQDQRLTTNLTTTSPGNLPSGPTRQTGALPAQPRYATTCPHFATRRSQLSSTARLVYL